MSRSSRVRCQAILILGMLASSSAWAAAPAEPDREWLGRYCTPLGCRGSTDSALGNALGFAVAAGAVGFLARRRRA